MNDYKIGSVRRSAGSCLCFVQFYYRPYLYLDQEQIAQAGLEFEAVREALAAGLRQEPGIHIAATR